MLASWPWLLLAKLPSEPAAPRGAPAEARTSLLAQTHPGLPVKCPLPLWPLARQAAHDKTREAAYARLRTRMGHGFRVVDSWGSNYL